MKIQIKPILNFQNPANSLESLMIIEQLAWASPGENVSASKPKIAARIASKQVVQLAITNGKPVGSQFAFRFNWNQDINILTSWDEMTSFGWTNKVHIPTGNTGFLVGVGVIPKFRGIYFDHDKYWPEKFKASELLIAYTLDALFFPKKESPPIQTVIANARVPFYHKRPEMKINEYCNLRRADGKLFDPVLRFHERMGAKIIKPCLFSMEDAESLNAGCWVQYLKPFKP
ncbi:MAG: hypothetical protein WA055_03405 [Candidatus Moraniibacteriota bacterium]